MDIGQLRRLDVYAPLDAHTGEQKAFTTYMHYWISLAELITAGFGTFPFAAILTELESRKAYRALPSKAAACDLTISPCHDAGKDEA